MTDIVDNQSDEIVGDPLYFSPTTKIIYRLRWKDRYQTGIGWPADAKQLTDEQAATYSQIAPKGKMLGVDGDGNPTWTDLPPLTNEQASRILNSKLNDAMDQVAAAWGYNKGIDNATTWSNSKNPQFAAEGRALADWRDAVWDWAAAQPAGTISLVGAPAMPTRPGA